MWVSVLDHMNEEASAPVNVSGCVRRFECVILEMMVGQRMDFMSVACSVDGRWGGDVLCRVRDMALSISRRLIRSFGPSGQWRRVGSALVANGSLHCPHGEGMCYFLFNLFDYVDSCFWVHWDGLMLLYFLLIELLGLVSQESLSAADFSRSVRVCSCSTTIW